MQSPKIFIAQNPQQVLGKGSGTFHWRNWSKQFLALAMIVISGAAASQCKLFLKIYEERQGKETKMLERKSLVHKARFWITMIPKTSKTSRRFMVQIISASFRMAICGVFVAKWPGHRLERRIFELFGVSLSADHKITRTASHTPKIWLKKLGMVQPPWLGFPPKHFFPKQGWFSNEHVCNKDLCAFVGNTGLLSNLARANVR